MAAATTFRHHRRRHSRARPACTHTACFRLPALNSGGGHCIYMLHTETANKRGADLNNVSSNSVLARCDVAPLPSSPLLLPIYAYPSHVQDDRIIVSKRKNNEFLYNVQLNFSFFPSTGRKLDNVFSTLSLYLYICYGKIYHNTPMHRELLKYWKRRKFLNRERNI